MRSAWPTAHAPRFCGGCPSCTPKRGPSSCRTRRLGVRCPRRLRVGPQTLGSMRGSSPIRRRTTTSSNAKRSALSPALIYAIMREESAFDPDAESPADAYGLMQLIVPTAKTMARPLGLPFDRNSLKRPSVNVALGASALAKYSDAFPENTLLSIAAYNAGPLNPRRWLRERPNADFDIWVELIPFVETRRYMKRVLSSRAAYAFLYRRDEFEGFASLPAKVQ